MEAHHLDAMVNAIDGVETYFEKDKPGVVKTGKTTRESQFLMAASLAENGIRIGEDLFTVTREKTALNMLSMLREQMERYHWSVKKPNNEFAKERVTLTGKVGNLQDDLYIAVSMCLYVGRIIIQNQQRLKKI